MKLYPIAIWAAVCFAVAVAVVPTAADDERSEQLKVLELWVGEFDCVIEVKPGRWGNERQSHNIVDQR